MYLWYILPAASSIDGRGRLIDDVVGFPTIPAGGDGTLTHHLYVSLVSSQMETVSKTYHFKIGQYHLALLNSPEEEAYKHLFGGLLSYLGDTIYIKTQVFRLLRYYSPAPRNIARSDWATQNITHNMTSSIT